MRKYLTIFLIAFAMLRITARAFPATNALAGKCYQAEVADISGKKYFPAVKDALEKAEKSINLAMFTIEMPLEGKNSKVSQLIDALIGAKNRGVEVEVILDQDVDFVHRGHPSDWEVEIKSTRAFKRLKDAGIKAVPFSYEDVAKYLGIYEGWTATDYRRQIIRALRT